MQCLRRGTTAIEVFSIQKWGILSAKAVLSELTLLGADTTVVNVKLIL